MNKYLFAALIILVIVCGIGLYYSHENQPLVETLPTASSTTAVSSTASPHQSAIHLAIVIHGISAPIPQISTTTASGQGIVLNPNGVITFSPALSHQTLGNVFAALNEPLTPTCFGTYCASETNSFRIYVNGKLYQSDPRQIPLASGQEIAIIYGTAKEIPNPVPSSYSFGQ